MTDNKIHERLKSARIAAGFKRAVQFCEKFNIPISTYTQHESGQRSIKSAIAEQYASLLGIDIAWLLTGRGSPYNGLSAEQEKIVPLREKEFLDFLAYSGSNKIIEASRNTININPVIFTQIVVELKSIIEELNTPFSNEQLTQQAIEIYQNVDACAKLTDDLSIIVTSFTVIFKRKLIQYLQEKK